MKFYKKNKHFFLIGIIFLSLFILTACTGQNSTQRQINKSSTKNISTTGTAGSVFYSSIVQNGRYKTSEQRGLSLSNTNNMYDLQGFESGLLRYDTQIFSPDKFLFQEGQYLTKSMVTSWLSRKTKDNPNGLNPEDNQSLDADKRNPLILQQILEHDFVVKNGSGYKVQGVVVGLSINSIDYYQKEQYGATFQTPIKEDVGSAFAKEAANKILTRMRKNSALKDIPIYVYVYRQGAQDSLVGGDFILSANNKDSGTFNNWESIKEKNVIYPVIDNQKPVNQKDADDFVNFKNSIQEFFPSLAGVVAQMHYENGALKGIIVKITTQFYSTSEIMSFTKYCTTMGDQYLPKGIPVEIDIKNASGEMLSFIARNSNESSFYVHVFSSY